MCISRRNTLRLAGLGSVSALAACATTTPATNPGTPPAVTLPTLTDTQILADASGIVSSLSGVVTAVNSIKPGALPANVATYVADAQQLVTSLTSATPAASGASTLQKIDTDISNILSAVGPIVGGIYPVAGPIIAAVQVVLPGIEAWVNPLITQATGVSATAPASPAALAAARKTLFIPVVK